MENIGWNYDGVNPSGKNIFFFRDTHHTDPKIQQKLTDEIEINYRQGCFDTLFVEGYDGNHPVHPFCSSLFDTEEKFKEFMVGLEGYWSADEIIAYRLRKDIEAGNFKIIGVDNEELSERQNELIDFLDYEIGKGLERLADVKKDERSLTEGEKSRIRKLNQIIETTSMEREVYAAKRIAEETRKLRLGNAGLLFGEGHYNSLVSEIAKRTGLGCISYFPGEGNITMNEDVEWVFKEAGLDR